MKKYVSFLLVLFLGLQLVGCANHMPSPKKAHSVVTRQFRKYSKHYKESDFGHHRVDKVEIVKVNRMQRGMAEVESYVYLKEGPVYWVRSTLVKKTFGWKAVSWETLGVRQ